MLYLSDKKYSGAYAGQKRISVVLFLKENPFLDFKPLDTEDDVQAQKHVQEHQKKQNLELRKAFEANDPKLYDYFFEKGGLDGINGYASYIGDDEEAIEVFFEQDEDLRSDYMERMGYKSLASGFVFSFSDEEQAHPEKFPIAQALRKHLEQNYHRVSDEILDAD